MVLHLLYLSLQLQLTFPSLRFLPDRYDNDFKDSDYFESTYDVEDNLHIKEENTQKSEDKLSILDQIRAYQNESKTEEKQKSKEQEILR